MFFKHKIIFKSLDYKFKDVYPPIESKKLVRPCIKKFNIHHKESLEKLKEPKCPFTKIFNTAKCPGILNLISIGYILRLHRDIRIKTKNDNEGFEWDILQNDSDAEDPTLKNTISYFLSDQFSDHYKLSDNSLKTLIKINLPWRIKSKKYNFLVLHPSYFEENRFTVMNGIIDSNINPELNVILAWNKLNSVDIISAGTPLCHLIPIEKNTNLHHVYSDATRKDLQQESERLFKLKITNY